VVREFSVPPVVTIGDNATLTDPVWDNAATAPAAVQFSRRVDGTWQDVTCARFHAEVVALARGLLAAGIGPGERIGLMSKTRYEWTLVDYAIWAAGAVTVPIYETSSAEQVSWSPQETPPSTDNAPSVKESSAVAPSPGPRRSTRRRRRAT